MYSQNVFNFIYVNIYKTEILAIGLVRRINMHSIFIKRGLRQECMVSLDIVNIYRNKY